MKELLVIRHAKSSWNNPSLGDKERPLNPRGKRDAPAMAAWLYKQGLRPEVLISSPATRAKKTAKHFAQQFLAVPKSLIMESDLYFGHGTDYLSVVQNITEDVSSAAIFGHNPMITDFVNQFTRNYIANVPTCGIALIQLECKYWHEFNFNEAGLKSLYFPKEVL